MLESLGGQRGALQPQLEGFEQDLSRLKEWASGLTGKRAQLQSSLTALRDAVGQIEERTSAIAKDFANKVCQIVLLSLKIKKFKSIINLPNIFSISLSIKWKRISFFRVQYDIVSPKSKLIHFPIK